MSARTITRHAPGKLFIAGEYAVVEPGHPSILVAVDREVGVTVSGSDDADVVIVSDLYPRETRLRRRDGGLAGCDPEDDRRAGNGLGHVVSAIEVVNGLLAERGRPAPALRVSIESHLHDNGTKLGLGSSGAVTVAAVAAVAAYRDLTLSPDTHFRLAMLATARLNPNSSGGDLAAGVWGGWIGYYAPDRAAVVEMARRHGIEETIRAPWPGFGLRRLRPPDGLALEVGWTGEPASTDSLVSDLATRQWRGGTSHRTFLTRTTECVRASMRALELGDRAELLRQIRAARQVLAQLDEDVRLGIFTSKLSALCDAAEAVGGAAKPSGAGGGDCGIAFLDTTAEPEIARLRELWVAAGVRPLPIQVPPTEGSEG